MKLKNLAALLAVASLGLGTAQAATIVVGDPLASTTPVLISTSTTWTADNVYDLAAQVYVTNGATLTIEAGTVVRSTVTANGAGSLAVERGSQIFVNGTADAPVVMTSSNDDRTNYRLGANEWGNLTVMGRAVISNSFRAPVAVIDQNTTAKLTPDGTQTANMEGLTAVVGQENRILYGGNDDNDDSGSISYLSLRYGGRVVGLGNELNGLSLGGIGRGTDIRYVEIMNNVDDGIEIWGGTVNLKNFVIWNIGDDSLDVDQGWRGKAQFGLIVGGASANAVSGSGFGDNLIEIDGAERADAQPVTTTTLYNLTLIGQPAESAGQDGIAGRDGARMQLRNSILMNMGRRVISNDISDNEGSQVTDSADIVTFAETWAVNAFNVAPVLNGGTGNFAPASLYVSQSQGNAAIGQGYSSEITDSVFYQNLNAAAYTTTDAFGVTTAGASNSGKAVVVSASSPIAAITRSATPITNSQTRNVFQVTSLDPRAANDAVASTSAAPNDGFFTSANYRGAFNSARNWAYGWTAASEFGLLVDPLPAAQQTFAAGANVSQTFTSGNVSVTITLANVTTGGTITVNPRDINAAPAGRNASDNIDVVFDITTGGGLAFTGGATVVFTYNEAYLDGLAEGSLTRVTAVNGGTETLYVGACDTTANTVTVTGVNGFSTWYIGQVPAAVSDWASIH